MAYLLTSEGNPGDVVKNGPIFQTAPYGLNIVWVETNLAEERDLAGGAACPSLLFSSSCKISFSYYKFRSYTIFTKFYAISVIYFVVPSTFIAIMARIRICLT